jgi:hypothetical protein
MAHNKLKIAPEYGFLYGSGQTALPGHAVHAALAQAKEFSDLFNGQKYGGGGIIAMFMIDGPDWLVIELPLYLVVAWAAGRQVTTPLDR